MKSIHSESPGVSNHVLEHIVAFDGGRYVFVVIDEFGETYGGISALAVPGDEELVQDLLWRLDIVDDFRIHAAVILGGQVLESGL